MKYAWVIQCVTVTGVVLFLLADLIVKLVQTRGNAFVTKTLNSYLTKENCSSNMNTIVAKHE